jgi:peptide/nickel transport system substrate-binding protein
MWPAGGPFVFAEWVHSGEYHHIRLVRNENYWKTDAAGNRLPYLDEVRVDFIPETESIISAFTNRRVDVIQPPPFVPEIPRDQWEAAGASVQLLSGPVWEHINFQFGPTNRNAESLNGYLEFRQAIAYGLDRRALLDDAGYEWLEVADGFLDLFTVAASSQPWSQYRYDPERARQLLAVACEKAERNCAANPPRVVYSTTSNADFRPRVADQIVEQMAAIGIIVELELEDSQLFFGETMTGGTWDVGNWAWVGAQGSAAIAEFLDLFAPDRPYREGDPADRYRNYYAWGTPESSVAADDAVSQVQTLLDRLRSSADGAEVVSLARQVEEILAEQVVIIPLNARAVVGAVWADEIQGFRMNPTQAAHTWNIEQWYRVGE